MTDSLLVEAVRNRVDGALGAVYDAHAAALYQYCWFLLADDDAARAVVRDVFIVVEGRIDDLADAAALRAWLFAIARGECRRRMATGMGSLRDLPQNDADPADAEPRAVAIAAIAGLDHAETDMLVLRTRFRLEPSELALVTGVPEDDVAQVLTRGGEHLRDALTAEILTRKGPSDCPRRAEILDGWGGRMTPSLRDGLVRHASVCEQCESGRPRTVAAAKVLDTLPWPALPATLRVRVMSSVGDPSLRGYRDFVLYRTGVFERDGFPRVARSRTRRRAPARPRRRTGVRACVSLMALLLVATGVAVAVDTMGGPRRAVGTLGTWADEFVPRLRPSPASHGGGDPGGRVPVSYRGVPAPDALRSPAPPGADSVPRGPSDTAPHTHAPAGQTPDGGTRVPGRSSHGDSPPGHGTTPSEGGDTPPGDGDTPPGGGADPTTGPGSPPPSHTADPTPSDPPSSATPPATPPATQTPPASGSPSS